MICGIRGEDVVLVRLAYCLHVFFPSILLELFNRLRAFRKAVLGARWCSGCSYVLFCCSLAGVVVLVVVVVVVAVVVVVVAFWRCCCRSLFRGFSGMLLVSLDASGHLWAALWGPLGSRVRLLGSIGLAVGGPWASMGAP